jgi:shikimate dehydrogenase
VSKRRVGVIGDPVAHSLSPVFQQAAFDALGIPARYDRWHTPEGELPARIETLRAVDCYGANVTVPHKVAVASLVDELADAARRLGAVNTVINRNGHLIGDNTDLYGFQQSLQIARPAVERDNVLVIGAGGASRAVVAGLAGLGVAGITVANRTTAHAEQMLAEIDVPGANVIPLSDWALLSAIRDHSVIVNATSIGWNDDQAVLAPEVLDAADHGGLIVDLTYRDTPLLREARARAMQVLDGLPMLVYQGARSFEHWTGVDAPIDVMMSAAMAARHS